MSKSLRNIFFLATAVLLCACSQDEEQWDKPSDSQAVTFRVSFAPFVGESVAARTTVDGLAWEANDRFRLRIACPYAEQQSWLDRAEALARSLGAEISQLDRVRADFPDGWFLMRKSVTAEQITLRAEARTRERLQALLDQVAGALPEAARDALKL